MSWRALRYRDFRVFWSGALVSAMGTEFTNVALLWQVYLITHSALDVGFLGLARAVPVMVMALFGGLLADAVDRRRLLMVTQVVQCGVSAALAVLTITGAVTQASLYVCTVLLALSSSLETPARQALVPNLVPPEDLSSALALNISQRSVASIVGPSIAGVVLAFAGPEWCYGVDALSWLAMLVALLAIHRRPQATSGRRGMSFEALRGGLAFVLASPVILALMVLDFGATFFGTPRAVLPIYAQDILGVGASGLGILYASISVGTIVSIAVMGRLPARQRAGFWVIVGVIIYGVATVGFAFSQVFWLSVLMLALTGAGNAISAVLRGTINQTLTPDNLRGRVSSVNSIFVSGGPQLGVFESGLAADLWGPVASAWTGGAGAVLVAMGVALVPGARAFTLVRPSAAEAKPAIAASVPVAAEHTNR